MTTGWTGRDTSSHHEQHPHGNPDHGNPDHGNPDHGNPDHGTPDPGTMWDQRYAEMDWPSEPDETLVELAGRLAPGRALDLGCGPGRNAIWLARQGWRVTGVDTSAVGLAKAEERARAAGVSLDLVKADVLTFEPPPAKMDLVVVANLHFAPGEREGVFARAAASLAPGGHLYVVGHHLDSLGHAGPPVPERLYTEDLLAELLAPLTVEVRRHERPSGDGGPALVDAVAWATAPSGR